MAGGDQKKRYGIEEKAEVLAYIDATGCTFKKASKEFGIPRGTVSSWYYSRNKAVHVAKEMIDEEMIDLELDENGAMSHDEIRKRAEKGQLRYPKLVEVVAASEERKQRIIGKAEAVVEEMLSQVMSKVEDSNLDSLISAIDRLLDRIEQMTYRPQVEQREDKLVERLLSGSEDLEKKQRVEAAVIEALKRRGSLGGNSDEPISS